MPTKIPCDRCDGSGMTLLDEVLSETLAQIPRKGFVTSHSLNEKLPHITTNAFNNRLERLRDLGLVTRARFGKFFRYIRA